jgi:hypothetical protein
MRLSKPLGPSGKGAKSRCGTSKPANPKAPCALWTRERRGRPGSARTAATGYWWSAIWTMARRAEWRWPQLMHDQPSDTGRARTEILLWDIAAAEPVDTSPGKQDLPMNRAQFSPRGTYLLAIGSNPASKISEGLLWNLSAPASNRQPAILKHDEGETPKAGFSADGGSIFAGCQNVEKRAQLAARRDAVTKKLALADCFVPEVMPLVLDLRLLRWSIAPLDLEPKRISKFGQLLAARSLRGRKMDAVTADELRNLWNEHGLRGDERSRSRFRAFSPSRRRSM